MSAEPLPALVRRDELVREQLAHGPRRGTGAEAAVRAGATGSGAGLLVLTWSTAGLRRERAAGVRMLGRLGVGAGMRVANNLPGALATPGALLLGDVVEDCGALDVPLGTIDTANAARQAWELIDRVQPQVLILDDSTASCLLAEARGTARPWWDGIIWLRQPGSGTPAAVPDGAGFGGWQRTWLAVPEVASFVAGSCAAGFLHADDGVAAEIVDGELVVTARGGEPPAVRYASGLHARSVDACTCAAGGRAFVLL